MHADMHIQKEKKRKRRERKRQEDNNNPAREACYCAVRLYKEVRG